MINRNGMGLVFAGVASALTLGLILGCAKQSNAPTPHADTQAQVVAQTDIPEVIVTASREDTVARR